MKNSVYCYLLFFLMMISSSLNAQQKDYKYSKSNITQEFLDVTLKERLYKNLQQNTPSTINKHDLSHYYFDNYAQYKQQFVQIAANVKQETKQVFLDVLNSVNQSNNFRFSTTTCQLFSITPT